jgi:hypothetical protein
MTTVSTKAAGDSVTSADMNAILGKVQNGTDAISTTNLTVNGTISASTGTGKCCGTGTIANGQSTVTISNMAVTASSYIFLTIGVTTDTGTAKPLKVDTITAATSFIVRTSDETVTTADVPFSYLIIN